jgi:hypothetical protein
MCARLRYFGRNVVDSKVNAGEGWFGMEDGTVKAHLAVTRRLSIFKTSTQIGPPICVETTGTWSGAGRAGTFVLNNDETLTFR